MSDVCAVDFTPSSVQLMVRRRSGATAATEAMLPHEAIEEGRVLQPNAVHFYLERMMKQLKVKKARIRMTLADTACVTRVIDYPRMPRAALDRSLRLELGRELPMKPADVYTGWHVIEEHDSHVAILLVAAWRDAVESHLEAIDQLGEVTVIEPRSHALARAVGMRDALVLDWSDERLQVARIHTGCVTYTSSVRLDELEDGPVEPIVHAAKSMLPKPAGDASEPDHLVLVGKLRGRQDVAAALVAGTPWDTVTDWQPQTPYQDYASSSQLANVGMLMRK